MLTPEEILNRFYIAYWAWLQDGAQEDSVVFSRRTGLCTNLWCFGGYSLDASFATEIMLSQFHNAGLNITAPFHEFTKDYWKEGQAKLSHLNPKRIEWVRNKVSQLIF
jgi:hypothetical protein